MDPSHQSPMTWVSESDSLALKPLGASQKTLNFLPLNFLLCDKRIPLITFHKTGTWNIEYYSFDLYHFQFGGFDLVRRLAVPKWTYSVDIEPNDSRLKHLMANSPSAPVLWSVELNPKNQIWLKPVNMHLFPIDNILTCIFICYCHEIPHRVTTFSVFSPHSIVFDIEINFFLLQTSPENDKIHVK